MKQQIQVLVIDGRNVKCERGHDPFFNLKIKGHNKRFCTHISGTIQTEGGIHAVQCGDIKIGGSPPTGMSEIKENFVQ